MWTVVLIVFILIYLWFYNKFKFFKNLGFPYVDPIIPFGSAIKVGSKEHFGEFSRRSYENFKNKGPAFGIYIFTLKILIPTDLIKEILAINFESFYERGLDLNFDIDPLSENLFFLSGQKWRELRTKLTPVFTSGKLKLICPIVSSTADRMVDFLNPIAKNHESVNLQKVFNSYTIEVIVNIAFGLETTCIGDDNNEFFKHANQFLNPNIKQKINTYFLLAFPKIASALGISFNSRKATEFFYEIVKNNLEYREKNSIQRNDFFQLLINLRNKEKFSINDIAANCFVFFLAGLETSSNITTFCAYELALNQIIQNRLRNEIDTVLKTYNGTVTYDAIMDMKYLDMIFSETIRKYPIVDDQTRRCTKDFRIPKTDLIIPAGTNIMIPVFGLHNDERYFKNPSKFNPERFSKENIKKINPFTYLPFSKGPRHCIGSRLGTIQTKLGLIKLLQNFKILTCEKTLIPMKFCPKAHIQNPLGGMWLKIQKLENNE